MPGGLLARRRSAMGSVGSTNSTTSRPPRACSQSTSSDRGTVPVMARWWSRGRGGEGVGGARVEERDALAAAPAETGRGVAQVEVGGQDLAVALLAQRPVE